MRFKKLLINNRDFINKLESQSLNLNVDDADEYEFSFTLTPIDQEEFNYLIANHGAEIKLVDDSNQIYYGAFMYSMYTAIFSKGINNIYYRIEIDTQSYTENTSRISAKWTVGPTEPDPDLNQMELTIYNFAKQYLEPKGYTVLKSNIVSGLHTKEISSEDTDELKTFKEVMDFIVEATNSHWYISKEKVFYVDRGITQYRVIEEPFVFLDDVNTNISKNRHFLQEDFELEITNEDYFNRLILFGASAGNHYVLDTDFLDENGDLKYQVENTTEQQRIAAVTGTNGIIEREENNSKLDTVEALKAYGDQLIAKYGTPVLNIRCILQDGTIDLRMGDFIYIKHNHRFDSYLQTYKPELLSSENLIFCIDSIQDEDYGATGVTRKILKLSQRDENSVSKSFWNIFKDENSKVNTKQDPGNVFSNSVTIQMSKSISTEVYVNIVDGGE